MTLNELVCKIEELAAKNGTDDEKLYELDVVIMGADIKYIYVKDDHILLDEVPLDDDWEAEECGN